jgi:hypothetical protein
MNDHCSQFGICLIPRSSSLGKHDCIFETILMPVPINSGTIDIIECALIIRMNFKYGK